jgi:hypothetical protein
MQAIKYSQFIRQNFKYLNCLLSAKLWLMSTIIVSILEFINKYIFHDWVYIKFLAIAMLLDLITGGRRAWLEGNLIISKGLRKTVDKGIQYFAFLIICHVLTYVQVEGQVHHYLDWLPRVSCIYLILIEAKSVFENIYKIDKKLNLNYFITAVSALIKQIAPKNKDNTNPDN